MISIQKGMIIATCQSLVFLASVKDIFILIVLTIAPSGLTIYNKGDTNAEPTGGTRQLQYKLVMGEASWILKLVNSSTY